MKKHLPLDHRKAEDKREKEMVRQFRQRGMHDLADQVQARIDSRGKNKPPKESTKGA